MNLWLGLGDDFIHPLRSWDPLAHDTLKHHERLGNFKRVICCIIWCLPWGPQQRWEGRYSSRHRRRETEEVAGALLVECFFHFHKSMFLGVCIIHHSQMFGIAGSSQLGCSDFMNETNWSKTVGVLSFFVLSDRPCRKNKSSSRKRRALSFWMGILIWSMLQQQDLFLSDFGGIQCLLPAYCGICRWTVATTKPWRKKQQEQKVQDAQRRFGILHHLLCFDICEGLVTLVLAVCPCQVPDWAGRGSWRGTTKAEGPRVHHFYVMNCKVTTDTGDALCWCQIWSQIRLTGSRAEEMAEAALLLVFFVVAGVCCAHLVWRVRKGIVDDSSTVDAERCPEVVGPMYPHNISTQSLATSCDFGLALATISQQPNDTDVQFAGRRSKTVPRRPWDERWCFFTPSGLCHTEKRNRAQERDAVLLQELQEKELLDVMNLAVDEAALPCPLSGYVEPSFYGPFVLKEMSRVVSTLLCVSDEVLANTLSDINSLVFDRSHDFLAAGDWKERATESARTVKARSNVGS